jgi:hypothetical protein
VDNRVTVSPSAGVACPDVPPIPVIFRAIDPEVMPQ